MSWQLGTKCDRLTQLVDRGGRPSSNKSCKCEGGRLRLSGQAYVRVKLSQFRRWNSGYRVWSSASGRPNDRKDASHDQPVRFHSPSPSATHAACLAVGFCLHNSAYAQPDAVCDPSLRSRSWTFESINVSGNEESYTTPSSASATRTETPLIEVPQSVQVVTRTMLREQSFACRRTGKRLRCKGNQAPRGTVHSANRARFSGGDLHEWAVGFRRHCGEH